MYRVANERMARWEERHRGGRRELYYCECGEPACRARLALDGATYLLVCGHGRRNGWLLVAPGHGRNHRLIARMPSHEVVERLARPSEILRTTAPRAKPATSGELLVQEISAYLERR